MVIMSFGGNQSAAAAGRVASIAMASRRADITSYDSGLTGQVRQGFACYRVLAAFRDLVAGTGAPGMPVLKAIRSGTSNNSVGAPFEGQRFCHPSASAGNVTHPMSAPNAYQHLSLVLR